jgi:hypothetical protein
MALCIVNTEERPISAVRFIAQKRWFVAGDYNGHMCSRAAGEILPPGEHS